MGLSANSFASVRIRH